MVMTTAIELFVRSTDLDADGIANNARFFEYFEQARLEHLVALGIVKRPRPPGEASRSFTLAATRCRYLAPLRHRDRIRVEAWTEEVRNRSFILGYRILDADGGLVAEGDSAQVWLGEDVSATPFPESVRHALVESAG